jgi:hypothetical protein
MCVSDKEEDEGKPQRRNYWASNSLALLSVLRPERNGVAFDLKRRLLLCRANPMEHDPQAAHSPSDPQYKSIGLFQRLARTYYGLSPQSAADGKLMMSLIVEKEKLEEIQSDTRLTTV